MEPVTHLDTRYSEPGVPPIAWADGRAVLERAELFWLATVRTDGRPHVTPLIAVWRDGVLYFTTGAQEQKARNLAGNADCSLTTGCNAAREGLDLVVEGEAVRQHDEHTLRAFADAFSDKYGEPWRFRAGDGVLVHEGGEALLFGVAPTQVYGFGKQPFCHTRWTFAAP